MIIQNIQALRFVAAFMVLMHHTLPNNVHPDHYARIPSFITEFSMYGFAGVDIFFVISGFIMAETTRHGSTGLQAGSAFITRRFLRIYTAYWPVFFLALGLRLWLNIWTYPEITLWGSFLLLPEPKYLINVAWTLTYELYFYLVVGFLIFFTKRHAMAVMGILFVLLTSWVLIQHQSGFYRPENGANWRPVWDLFLTSPLILEFIAGFLLSGYLRRFPKQSLWFWIPFTVVAVAASVALQKWGGLTGVGMAAYLYYPERALFFGSAAIGLVAIAVIAPQGKSLPMRAIQKLGDASYALYLLHIPMLVILYGQLFPRMGQLLWIGGGKLSLLIYVVTCIAVSVLYFRWVETPLHQLSRKLTHKLFDKAA